MNLDHLLTLLKEVDCSSEQEKKSLERDLKQLVENIFRLQYWESEKGRDYKYWQTIVSNSRQSIQSLIERRPGIRRHMEQIYPQLYQNAVDVLQREFYIPNNTPIELEQILNQNYFG